MCVRVVVSLKARCYKADNMVHGIENQHVCDRSCVTTMPGCYWLITLFLALVNSPVPHPKCVTVVICLYSY